MSPPNKHVGAADWKATVFARLRWLLRPFRLLAAIALSVRGSELSLLAHASRPGDWHPEPLAVWIWNSRLILPCHRAKASACRWTKASGQRTV